MTEPEGCTGTAGWDCHVHLFDATLPLRAGHYTPVDRTLPQIEAEAARHGVHHLVLVQPSVYGSDNRLLLQGLAAQPGRHRGVVVLAGDEPDAVLDAMHAAGVRGARLNRVSPVGEGEGEALLHARFTWLAPRLRERGWHLQWYLAPGHWPEVAALHASEPALPCVLDHLGGLRADAEPTPAQWQALRQLAALGAWVKLSGWYRLGAAEPYTALWPRVRQLQALFGERLVWGSDWPHTHFAPHALPRYASTLAPVVAALGEAAAHTLRRRGPAIYC